MQAEARILPVDPEVQCEVVSRSGRDAHERKVVFDGDGGDKGLGAVPSGHTEAIGPAGYRVPCQLFQVEAVVEHDHLDAEVLGQVDKTKLRHLAPA